MRKEKEEKQEEKRKPLSLPRQLRRAAAILRRVRAFRAKRCRVSQSLASLSSNGGRRVGIHPSFPVAWKSSLVYAVPHSSLRTSNAIFLCFISYSSVY
jgi:hypothetical protein